MLASYKYLLLVLLYFSFPIQAQTEDEKTHEVEKVKVIAKSDKEEYQKTQSVKSDPSGFTDVIDLEKIKNQYTSLDEVLEREAGIRVRRYGGLGSYSTLSIRGSNANQVRFFIDGVPINNNMGGEVNLADLPFENLEKIEVYKSGTSAGFSGSAIGGVVNLLTKKGKKQKSTEIKLAGGSFKTIKLSALHKNFYKDLDYTFFVLREKSDQDFVFRNNNGTPILNTYDDFDDERENAWFDRYNFMTNLSYKFNSTTVTFLNDFNYRMHGIPGPGFNQTEKVKRKFIKNTSSLGTDTKEFWQDYLSLQTRFYYTGGRDELFDPKREFSSATPNSRADLQQYGVHLVPKIYLLEYHQVIRILAATERETFQRDARDIFHETVEKIPKKFRTHDIFQVQDEIRFFKKRLRLVPSLQFERYVDRYNEDPLKKNLASLLEGEKTRIEFTNYRFGCIGIPYKSKKVLFSWKFNGSIETRFPDFLELFGERGSIIGNSALEPEKSRNIDTGPVFDLQMKNVSLNTSLAFFNKNVEKMILFIPNSQFTLRPENVDSARIRGFEFGVKVDLFKRLRLNSNYTYQKAINTSDTIYLRNKYLALRPLHEWQAGVHYYKKDLFETGLRTTFVGAVFKDRTNEYQNYVPA
ncbi:MAG: TonB-dependent receptor, partial [Spirochaetota bacterium]